jgi:hypothetical protein
MYGLNNNIKNYIDKKIEKNKTFLKNMKFYTEDYKLVSMFDSDMNANLSPERYFAEVNNRVNTIFKISQELNLVPAFLTITAPPEYHFKSKHYNGSTPRKTALYLSKLWHKFLQLRIIRDIKKNVGHNMIYIRVYEPHKSGVPHLHAMIFVPKQNLKEIKEKFYKHFTKYNIKKIALKFIYKFNNTKKYDGVTGAIAYILKYMNKTFKNAVENKMSDEAYYFAFHGIRRFITSQTLIPLWIYRKIKSNTDNRDLLYLTKQYKQGNIYHHFDKQFIFKRDIQKSLIKYNCDTQEVLYNINEEIIYQKDHFISDQFKTTKTIYNDIPKIWIKKSIPIPTYYNGKIISHYYKGKDYPYKKHISQMTNFELLNYHNNYNIETDSYIRYLSIKNLLIDRKILLGSKFNLNNFNFDNFLLQQ